MTDTNNIANSGNYFFDEILAPFAAAEFDNYERKGYAVDGEGDYICPTCNEKASCVDDALNVRVPRACKCDRELKAKEERQRQKQAADERRAMCFVSKKMRGWNFSVDNGKKTKFSSIAKNYVSNFKEFRKNGRGLLLLGATGTGKSFLAACIANALIDEGYRAKQTTISRIESERANVYDKQAVIDAYARNSVVVIDEITEEDFTKRRQTLFDVIYTLCNAQIPMIITSNLTLDAFATPNNESDVRICQRILECCTTITIDGKSQRVKEILEGNERSRALLGL